MELRRQQRTHSQLPAPEGRGGGFAEGRGGGFAEGRGGGYAEGRGGGYAEGRSGGYAEASSSCDASARPSPSRLPPAAGGGATGDSAERVAGRAVGGGGSADGAGASAERGGGSADGGRAVRRVLKHVAFAGARPGSLHDVYVRVEYADGGKSDGMIPAQAVEGSAAWAAYLKTRAGRALA